MGRVRAYVVVAPGLETLAADELRSIGVTGKVSVTRGGIEADMTTRQMYAVHRWARISTRVLVRVAAGPARTFDELEALVASIGWDDYLAADDPVAVHAASQASRLYHEGAIAERVLGVLGRTADTEGSRVYLRLDRNRATISVDASGASLHHRGWRQAGHAAPLRPTIAAAMLRAVGSDCTTPVVDPMTGSGTIAIEAALIAAGRPHERAFAFQRWPSFEPGTWASVSAPVVARATVPAPIVAADRDAGAVETARGNVVAAGVDGLVTVDRSALNGQRWPVEPSLVVCNPPYGRRLGHREGLRDLYAALGRRIADGGHTLGLLTADDRLARATGLELTERFATTNGGIAVRCWST
jgi:putative N6-adenine-specific DNA methylase